MGTRPETVERCFRLLGVFEPGRIDLDAPARNVRSRHAAAGNLERVPEEQTALPGIAIISLDREFEMFPRIGDRLQK